MEGRLFMFHHNWIAGNEVILLVLLLRVYLKGHIILEVEAYIALAATIENVMERLSRVFLFLILEEVIGVLISLSLTAYHLVEEACEVEILILLVAIEYEVVLAQHSLADWPYLHLLLHISL